MHVLVTGASGFIGSHVVGQGRAVKMGELALRVLATVSSSAAITSSPQRVRPEKREVGQYGHGVSRNLAFSRV